MIRKTIISGLLAMSTLSVLAGNLAYFQNETGYGCKPAETTLSQCETLMAAGSNIVANDTTGNPVAGPGETKPVAVYQNKISVQEDRPDPPPAAVLSGVDFRQYCTQNKPCTVVTDVRSDGTVTQMIKFLPPAE